MPNDRPLKRDYARVERERRFALSRLPRDVDGDDFVRLVDLYITDSSLRLRRVERPDGSLVITKLGQKTIDPNAPHDPTHRQMTTLYLSETEGSLFTGFTGRRSVKRRYKLVEQGFTFMIDVYEQPESAIGKMVCEVECESDEQLQSIKIPDWADQEITLDSSYWGVNIADADEATA